MFIRHLRYCMLIVLVLGRSCPGFSQETIGGAKSDRASAPALQTTSKAVSTSLPGQNLKLIDQAAKRLVELQEEDGAWPYEGVYRVKRKIPVGYRIGGTSIACQALLSSPLKDRSIINVPVARGIELVLKELEHPMMKPSTRDTYDVRVWGHIYALSLFCQLESETGFEDVRAKTKPWINKLVSALVEEELDEGGWNYATRGRHAAFVTCPAVQSLLRARSQGFDVPRKVLDRAVTALLASRNGTGAYQYSGSVQGARRADLLPGSIARSAVSETTLLLMGKGSVEHLRKSIEAFHEHWPELEKRRQKTGTHVAPYGVAPYYFYYGHRYLAQAIQMLPAAEREKAYERFETVLFKTKEDDNTWNDRVFERSKAFGTSMSLLALARENCQIPTGIEDNDSKK